MDITKYPRSFELFLRDPFMQSALMRMPLREGTFSKGGQNPPNTSDKRPLPPGGSGIAAHKPSPPPPVPPRPRTR
jgi:hypothetical protein